MNERYKSLDVILPQGARSKFMKAAQAIEQADDLLPSDALDGTSQDIRQAIKHLQAAAENLTEMMAYRKIMGVD
jgi:delta-aminolevulinic acid dehydratase/porphobilinogen synthase